MKMSIPETHDNESNDKACEGAMGVGDDSGDGGNDKEDVTDHSDGDCDTYGLVSAPVGVSDVGAEEGSDIDPEGVEGGETCRSLLTEPKGTGLAVLATCSRM